MRGAPHNGFSRLIRRINSRSSRLTLGLPGEALVFADYSEEMGDFFYPWRFPMGLPHFSQFNELQKSGTLNRSTENQQISATLHLTDQITASAPVSRLFNAR